MRAVVQRVRQAQVTVDNEVVGAIGSGLLILLGVGNGDSEEEVQMLAQKTASLRIFADDEGRFNRSLLDTGGAALVVSQFTLYADTRRGRRPSFSDAAPPEVAAPLVDRFCEALTAAGIPVQTGRFGASMAVSLINDGPVTIILDTDELKRPRRN